MIRISDKASRKTEKIALGVWFGILLFLSIIIGIGWTLPFFIFGGLIYGIYKIKVKVVFLDEDSILVEHRGKLVRVNFSNILSVDSRSMLKGCYKINFKEKTTAGLCVYFIPRSKTYFDVHEGFKLFYKKFN